MFFSVGFLAFVGNVNIRWGLQFYTWIYDRFSKYGSSPLQIANLLKFEAAFNEWFCVSVTLKWRYVKNSLVSKFLPDYVNLMKFV